jgi:AraC-like DNA-binding protein
MAVNRMALSEVHRFVHQPEGILRRYVREILWLRSERPRVQVLLPETTLTLVLRQSGSALLDNQTLPSAIVSGLQQRARMVEHAAGSSLVIVRFTEIGAPPILHDRVDLLHDRTLPLDTVLPPQEIARIQNILADTRDVRQQVLAVVGFLTGRIRASNGISPQIEAAAQMIRNSEGRSSIRAIARHAAMSQSALERHFRALVGATPKTLCRLVRLQHVCQLWDAGKILPRSPLKPVTPINRTWCVISGSSPQFFRSPFPRNLPTFYK